MALLMDELCTRTDLLTELHVELPEVVETVFVTASPPENWGNSNWNRSLNWNINLLSWKTLPML